MNHRARFRVDGEVGRFEFETVDVRDAKGRIAFHGFDVLPIRTGKQWHQTAGFKETAILRGMSDRSYRKTALGFNIQRRQVKGGTPLNTLRDAAEAQGVAVMAAIEDETQRTFAENHVKIEGETVVAIDPPADSDDELKRVHTTVARIEHQGKGFTLMGPNLFAILRFALAFLLRNGLSKHRLQFYNEPTT